MNPLTRFLTALVHPLWRPWLRRRLGRVVIERIDGVPLVILPDVFNPVVFRTGTLLAQTMAGDPSLAPPADDRPRALDLGTGSGVGAVFAARRGWQVAAVDLNPEAVRCARVNALVNGLEGRIEVCHGDLFAPVAGERFGLVLFNPPYFEGAPRSRLDAAWRSPDVLPRFVDGLAESLAPGGQALVVVSTDGVAAGLRARLQAGGFTVAPCADRDFGNEVVTAYTVAR